MAVAMGWAAGSRRMGVAEAISEKVVTSRISQVLALTMVPMLCVLGLKVKQEGAPTFDGVVYRTLREHEATTAVWLVRRQNEGSPLALSFIDLVTREAASLRRR